LEHLFCEDDMRWSANGRVAALTQLEWAIQVYRPDRALTGRFQALLVLGRRIEIFDGGPD